MLEKIYENDDKLTTISPLIEHKVTSAHRLSFAKSILMGLAILFLLGMLSTTFTKKNDVFDACKTILPSIATLIIGYYFGEKSRD